MDYETGTATDPADLLSKLNTFVSGNGWTVSSPSSGVVFRKGDVVVGASADSDEVFFRGAVTYNGSAAWDNQTNNAGVTLTILLGVGPYPSYHFFTGDEDGADYVHVVVEISTGIYRHFVFGELVKSGSYTGGVYVDGVHWSSASNRINVPYSGFHQTICDSSQNEGITNAHLWVDYDSKTNNWQRIYPPASVDTTRCSGNGRAGGIDSYVQGQDFMAWNLRNVLVPLRYFANRESSLKSPIGRIPHMRQCGMRNLARGETITIGGESWIVFPIVQRTEVFDSASSSIPSSGYLGYAYRLP